MLMGVWGWCGQANTLQRQLFYVPSFKIYGSVAGFYDFGPPGCAVKQNITQFWRQHFVLEENMLEASLTPWNLAAEIRSHAILGGFAGCKARGPRLPCRSRVLLEGLTH